jgi:hypothetical protein
MKALQTVALALSTLLAAAVPVAVAHAELYKWVDPNGVTNYSDVPPTNARQTTTLDESKSSLSVFPGLSKDELARLEARAEQARADRLERENAELRARLAATPPPPPAPRFDDTLAYDPIYVPQVLVRRPPPDRRHFPVRGLPVQKTVPAPNGMRLDR